MKKHLLFPAFATLFALAFVSLPLTACSFNVINNGGGTETDGVELNYTTYSLAVGDTVQLTGSYQGNSDVSLSWKSSDKNVATVTSSGLVRGAMAGSCVITATYSLGEETKSGQCILTVYDVPVSEITLDLTNKTIDDGESFTLTATVSPDNATKKDLKWTTSDSSVAKVTNGLVTGTGDGEADITVSSVSYPSVTASCHVTVNPVDVESVSFSKETVSIHVGESCPTAVTVLPTNATHPEVTYSSGNESVATVSSSGIIRGVAPGETDVTVTSVSNTSLSDTIHVSVLEEGAVIKTAADYDVRDLDSHSVYTIDSCPNDYGNLLIIPVWFSDSSEFVKDKDQVRDDIEKTYLGTNDETGWRSVKTYYEELSSGRMHLSGTVTDWYSVNASYTDYATSSKSTTNLVSKAVEWYKETYNYATLTNYDMDGNGYLDGVMLIYAAPDYQALSNSDYSNLWAYCYWVQDSSKKNTANPGPNVFFWASYDFMYGSGDTDVTSYHNGDTSHCTLDAHTFIHEMGHVFGAMDYYDYSNNSYSPAGGFSMQDYNVGSHDPYTTYTFGWVDPYVVTDTITMTIGTFQETKDLILVTPEYHDSPFDEYFLLELYSPTGLNEFDSTYQYDRRYPKGPTKTGIRLWHVDARLAYYNSSYEITGLGTNPANGKKVDRAFTNSYGESHGSPLGEDYYNYNELQLIRNDKTETYTPTSKLSYLDLFMTGDTFSMSDYSSQFVNGTKLNSGSAFNFTFSFISVSDSEATITITKG